MLKHKVSLTMDEDVLEWVDRKRGRLARSTFLNLLTAEHMDEGGPSDES